LKEVIMKTRFVTSALIIATGLIAGSSFAADNSGLTREQVRAAYFQARADGSLPAVGERQENVNRYAPSTLTRAEVMAEYFAAQKAGTLPAVGERQVTTIQSAPSTLTRDEVMSEYFAAQKAGILHVGELG
jgi:hypothetical protein